MISKQALRQQLRSQRRALSHAQRRTAAIALLENLKKHSAFRRARRVALYLPNDGEIATTEVINWLQRHKKSVFLPALHPVRKGHLVFAEVTQDTRWTFNRYGIREPDFINNKRLLARFLNIICLPLVAFDHQGNRLGMGGGYYDRTLARLHNGKQGYGANPALIGCAFEFQAVTELPSDSWDIPLSAIATDAKLRTVITNR